MKNLIYCENYDYPTDLLNLGFATNFQFVKATVSEKHNKVKFNKMRYTPIVGSSAR